MSIHANNWKPTIKNFLPILFFAAYVFVRFYWLQTQTGLGEYTSYYFEAAYAVLVLFYFRKQILIFPKVDTQLFVRCLSSLILGVAVYFGAGGMGIVIPFDLKAQSTVLFLLLVGPILEELLFRGALWVAIEHYFSKAITLVLTSVLFAFAHFQAYYYVAVEFHDFIFYQTTYTFIIAILWGLRFIKTKSVGDAILLHMAFNFGFYSGFLIRG
jgi:membrane protease YdiL (CAAX protease family)